MTCYLILYNVSQSYIDSIFLVLLQVWQSTTNSNRACNFSIRENDGNDTTRSQKAGFSPVHQLGRVLKEKVTNSLSFYNKFTVFLVLLAKGTCHSVKQFTEEEGAQSAPFLTNEGKNFKRLSVSPLKTPAQNCKACVFRQVICTKSTSVLPTVMSSSLEKMNLTAFVSRKSFKE